jgi:membrane protein implicated in regulation of membrane protease activity
MNWLGGDLQWLWLIGGVLLLIAEVVAPGFFLFFIGGAAVATGLLALAFGLPVVAQLAVFAVLAITFARVGGRRAYAMRYGHSSDPLLNDRVARLLGKVVVVVEPIDGNSGRVRVGDSLWSARGQPAAVGERVRVVDVDGNCLKVEAEHTLPPA